MAEAMLVVVVVTKIVSSTRLYQAPLISSVRSDFWTSVYTSALSNFSKSHA